MSSHEQVTQEMRDAFDAVCKGRVEAAVKAERALWELSKLGQEIEAQPEQEPYGWRYTNKAGVSDFHSGPSARLDADMEAAKNYPDAHKVTPLYTTPPQRPWVGLTDEERDSVLDSVPPDNMGGEYYDKEITAIAFAIEAKLKEKNTCQE